MVWYASLCMMYLFNPFPNKPWFLWCLQYKSFENTAGKGEIARDEQFLLFPKCFLRFWKTFRHSHQNENCYLQTFNLEESKICSLGKG